MYLRLLSKLCLYPIYRHNRILLIMSNNFVSNLELLHNLCGEHLGLKPTRIDEIYVQDKNLNLNEILNYIIDVKAVRCVNDIYSELLGRNVDVPSIKLYKDRFMAKTLNMCELYNHISICDERKQYIQHQSLDSIKDLKIGFDDISHISRKVDDNPLNIVFYGILGSTGYAQASKAYFYALYITGANISFEVLQKHPFVNVKRETLSDRDLVLYHHLHKPIDNPDVIIFHSVPDQWPGNVERQRERHPQALIIGITVWETNKVHPLWVGYMNLMDKIYTPCEWNRVTFTKQLNIEVHTIHTPLECKQQLLHNNILNIDGISKKTMIYYTINEWNARKGIDDLITCFVNSFTEADDVILYVKSSAGNASKCAEFINMQLASVQRPPRIFLDMRDLTDYEISAIHSQCHVYCSFTKAEGTGLGALEAIIHGNPVIMSGYGGQMDYMKGALFISCSESPPNMCSSQQIGHEYCNSTDCLIYPWYQKSQIWGAPSLEDAKKLFKFVYHNYKQCRSSAKLSALYAKANFTYQVVGDQFQSLLRNDLQQHNQH